MLLSKLAYHRSQIGFQVCTGVYNCVHPGESFTWVFILQILASIQPRTSLVKFARSPWTDPTFWFFIKIQIELYMFSRRCWCKLRQDFARRLSAASSCADRKSSSTNYVIQTRIVRVFNYYLIMLMLSLRIIVQRRYWRKTYEGIQVTSPSTYNSLSGLLKSTRLFRISKVFHQFYLRNCTEPIFSAQ